MKTLLLCGLALVFACGPIYLPYTFKINSKDGTGIEGRYGGSIPSTGKGIMKAAGLDGENFTGTYHTVRRFHYNSRLDHLGGKPAKGKAILKGDRGTIIRCKYEHVYFANGDDIGFGKCQTNRGDKWDLEF